MEKKLKFFEDLPKATMQREINSYLMEKGLTPFTAMDRANKSDLVLWSEVIHPWAFYAIPLLTLIFLLLTIKYSFDLYVRQDELFRKYHDFSMMSGFMGFAVFGIILHYTSVYVEFEVQWIDYMLCSIAGMVIGQLYFYKKFYQ